MTLESSQGYRRYTWESQVACILVIHLFIIIHYHFIDFFRTGIAMEGNNTRIKISSVEDSIDVESPIQSTSWTGAGDARPRRQLLRPWLIDQIDEGDIKGLVWLDRDNLMFKIPWKHFGKPGFNEHNDPELFRRWAIHTERFKEGEKSDFSAWKTFSLCTLQAA